MRCLPLLALLFAGCRGPRLQEIAGTGLTGAVVFALTSWFFLSGVIRVWERLRHGSWQQPVSSDGWLPLIGVHLTLTIIAVIFAEGPNDSGLTALVWGCAAANHLAWAIIIWRIGRMAPGWAALWAAIPCLALAIPGGFGHRDAAEWTVVMWIWGGFLGATPAVLAVIVWIEAWLRGRSAHP